MIKADVDGDISTIACLEALRNLLEILGRIDRDDVLKPMLEAVRECAPVDTVGVYVVSKDGRTVERFSLIGNHARVVPGMGEVLPVSDSDLALLALEDKSHVFGDLLAAGDQPRQEQHSAIRAGIRSAAAVPVRTIEDQPAIVVFGSQTPEAFDEGDLRFLKRVAKLVGIHLRNQDILRWSLHTERLTAAVEERRRLARETKGEEIQALISIAGGMRALLETAPLDEAVERSLIGLKEQVETAIANLRRSIAALDTGYPLGLSLEEALGQELGSLETRLGITTRWNSFGSADDLSSSATLALHRAALRRLAAIEKEGTATRVSVHLEYGPEAVILEMEDDGHVGADRGFESGPAGMIDYQLSRSQMAELDGTVDLRRAPGWGTRITWRLPARHLTAGTSPRRGSLEKPIRLLVIHGCRLTRESVARLLDDEPDLDVVGQVGDCAEASRVAEATTPDVVIFGSGGLRLEAAQALLKRNPGMAAVLLDCACATWTVDQAVAMGARACLSAEAEVQALLSAIREVAQGESVLDPRLTGQLMDRMQESHIEPLTDREREVLMLVAEGLSNREIGEKLVVAESTVRWHVHNVLQKLDAKNRTDAVRIGCARGLIPRLSGR